ncbi:hypothetical protein KY363_04250 [Candidatus Woesearchaeota archaeon]|nr:hypothetical protein [Candidatus Woesearchaeota archaeon]
MIGKQRVILYLVSDKEETLGRLEADLASDSINDGVWTDVPKDYAYSRDCVDMFRKEAAEAGANVYILSNPSYRAVDYMIFLTAIKELNKLYEARKKKQVDADIHIVRSPDGSTFCFAGGRSVSDDVLDELAETHRVTYSDRLPN